MEVFLIFIVIIIIVVLVMIFNEKSNENVSYTPQEKIFIEKLEKISDETGITDLSELNRIRIERENKIRNQEKLSEFKTTGDEIEFNIAGIHFRTKLAKEEAESLSVGDFVNLKSEPINDYDSTAVKVISNRKHIGFVPSVQSEEVTEFIENNPNFKAIVTDTAQEINYKYCDYDLIIKIRIYPE